MRHIYPGYLVIRIIGRKQLKRMFGLNVVHSSEDDPRKCEPGMAGKFLFGQTGIVMNMPLVTYYSVKECYANPLCLREQCVIMYAQNVIVLEVTTFRANMQAKYQVGTS